jgi:hypothetical protein
MDFPLQDLVSNRAAQHVAGDVPAEQIEGRRQSRDNKRNGDI